MDSCKRNHTFALVALILTTLFWGAGFLLNDIALSVGATPSFINCVRFVGATVIIGTVFCKKIKINKQIALYGTIGGIFLFGGFLLQLTGLKYTTPANNGFFTAAYVLFVPFIHWIASKKRPPAIVFCGVILALIGYVILNFGNAFDKQPDPEAQSQWLGNLLTVAGSVFFALQIVLSDSALKKADAMSLTFMQLLVAGVLFAAYFLIFDLKSVNFAETDPVQLVLPLIFMTLCGTAFAYAAQTFAQKTISPSETSLILSAESVVGAVISIAFGRENFTWYISVGGLIVVAAVIIEEVLPEYLAARKRNKEKPSDDGGTE
ncbi:MAG: DMT family transporter [Corallococcus sp.]|nr:DMT family transporter [Corallococcus sp.]